MLSGKWRPSCLGLSVLTVVKSWKNKRRKEVMLNIGIWVTKCIIFIENIGFTLSVRPSVCPSVPPSVCPLTFCVRPERSSVQDGFFPYLVQMINSMRGCVACDDLWPWPIFSRSFGLDLENRVCSVAPTVLDGLFLYLAQMITIIRGCVTCYDFFRMWKFKFLAIF